MKSFLEIPIAVRKVADDRRLFITNNPDDAVDELPIYCVIRDPDTRRKVLTFWLSRKHAEALRDYLNKIL